MFQIKAVDHNDFFFFGKVSHSEKDWFGLCVKYGANYIGLT